MGHLKLPVLQGGAIRRRDVGKLLLSVVALVLLVTGPSAVADVPTAVPASVADLTADIDQILTDARLTGSQAGVLIRDADTDEVLYARNPETRLLPASNNKLFTSVAALEVLGPDYTFTTRVSADGRRDGSFLAGDLYLTGGGDPTTLAADYDALAARIADSGIRTVGGRLVADDTFFDANRLGTDWANDDEPYYYAAQISALTVSPDTDYDAGTVIVEVTSGSSAGAPAQVKLIPETGYVHIDNRATTAERTSISVEREHGTNTIVVSGTVASGGLVKDWASVWEPTGYAADVFRRALTRHGIRVLGDVTRGTTPDGAQTLASHESMPLSRLLVPFMKLSNNGHAEVLTKAMGRKAYDQGSWSAGLRAGREALAALGGNVATMRMVDGSGLSRRDLTTPMHLSNLLRTAQHRSWFPVWYESLPVAGEPDRMVGGTLRSRMRGTPAAGNVHAKTGSLTAVTALSGYVSSADGERLIFSIVFNNHLSGKPSDLEDRIAVRLARFSRSEQAGAALEPYRPEPPRHRDPRADHLECSWLKAC
ncbi:MAG TPA: D-alanyl-D-alanine carboxypeptidase/D-alanyl-D-alanine-endopeptidase [Micromonosporaceae bacterium]